MKATDIDVLRALRGFRMAAGAAETDATSWAADHQQEGLSRVQEVVDGNQRSDPGSIRRAALAALKQLAQV